MVDFDSLVVGGGLHGCLIADRLAARGDRVLLVEKQADLLTRASFTNQGRLHIAYPQSPEAASQARANLTRLLDEFRGCVVPSLPTYYAVGRSTPKIGATHFHAFCRQVGTPIEPAPEAVRRLFDPAHIETVFRVEEAAFDAGLVRVHLRERLGRVGVAIALETTVERVRGLADGSVLATLSSGVLRVERVFNCAYSHLNSLLLNSSLSPLPIRHELAELALVEVPAPLRQLGLTILSGPFFSLAPFASSPYHTLSHVRFLPHASWGELGPDGPTPDEALAQVAKQTGFERMRREATRYMPCLAEMRYQRSLWEVRTSPGEPDAPAAVLRAHPRCRNLYSVLGTRLDAVYDVLDQIEERLPQRRSIAA